MLEWIERRFKSAYLRLLESEVERLREENRQLVNSMLVSHGMPGIEAPRLPQDMRPVRRATWADYKRRKEKETALPTIITPGGPAKPVNVAPAPQKPKPDAS